MATPGHRAGGWRPHSSSSSHISQPQPNREPWPSTPGAPKKLRLLSGESKCGGPGGAGRVGEPTWTRTGAERPSGPKLQGCHLQEHKVQGARGGQPSGNTGRSSELTGPLPGAHPTLPVKGPAHLRGPRGGGSSWQPRPGPRSPDLQPDLQRGG